MLKQINFALSGPPRTPSPAHLERPKAAKLKPGRKHRSPLFPAPTSRREEPPLFPSTLSAPLIKPTRPSLAHATRSHFGTPAPEGVTKEEWRSLMHADFATPNLRMLSDKDAAALTQRIQTRYAEKTAARMQMRKSEAGKVTPAPVVSLTPRIDAGVAPFSRPLNTTGNSTHTSSNSSSVKSKAVTKTPGRNATINASSALMFRSGGSIAGSGSDNEDFQVFTQKTGKFVRSVGSSGFDFQLRK